MNTEPAGNARKRKRANSDTQHRAQSTADEIAAGESAAHPLRRRLFELRLFIDRHPQLRIAYLTIIAVIGVVITIAGVVMLVIPGPGWLTIFLGLAILGTEFHWARRMTGWTKERIRHVIEWWQRRRGVDSNASDEARRTDSSSESSASE